MRAMLANDTRYKNYIRHQVDTHTLKHAMAHPPFPYRSESIESKRGGGIEVALRDVSKRQMFREIADARLLPLTNWQA